MAKNINGEAQIHTKVDGKKVIIFEAKNMKDLKFEDEGGVYCLSNEVIFEQLTFMGVEKDFSGRHTPLFPIMFVPAQEEELGEDVEITLVDETVEDQGRFDDQEVFDTDVLNDEEVVVKDVNVASIATDVTAATKTAVSIDDITLAQELVEINTLKPKERGIIMQEPSKTPTTTIPIFSKVQDKEKGIMVEEPLKMKKKDQISFDEQEARTLQAGFNEQDKLAEEKPQLIEDETLSWDNV
nr:hypothetical protein [Tanacetum cinerariifolium]